jgi:hypothetical protein
MIPSLPKLILLLLTLVPCEAQSRAPRPTRDDPPEKRTLPTWPLRGDPKPLVTANFLDLNVALDKGRIKLLQLTKGAFPKPKAISPRFRGRFEVQLFAASLLRDVIRFNFPLTSSSGDKGKNLDHLDRNINKGVSAKTLVKIPYDESITRIVIYDMVGGEKLAIPLSSIPHLPTNRSPTNNRSR